MKIGKGGKEARHGIERKIAGFFVIVGITTFFCMFFISLLSSILFLSSLKNNLSKIQIKELSFKPGNIIEIKLCCSRIKMPFEIGAKNIKIGFSTTRNEEPFAYLSSESICLREGDRISAALVFEHHAAEGKRKVPKEFLMRTENNLLFAFKGCVYLKAGKNLPKITIPIMVPYTLAFFIGNMPPIEEKLIDTFKVLRRRPKVLQGKPKPKMRFPVVITNYSITEKAGIMRINGTYKYRSVPESLKCKLPEFKTEIHVDEKKACTFEVNGTYLQGKNTEDTGFSIIIEKEDIENLRRGIIRYFRKEIVTVEMKEVKTESDQNPLLDAFLKEVAKILKLKFRSAPGDGLDTRLDPIIQLDVTGVTKEGLQIRLYVNEALLPFKDFAESLNSGTIPQVTVELSLNGTRTFKMDLDHQKRQRQKANSYLSRTDVNIDQDTRSDAGICFTGLVEFSAGFISLGNVIMPDMEKESRPFFRSMNLSAKKRKNMFSRLLHNFGVRWIQKKGLCVGFEWNPSFEKSMPAKKHVGRYNFGAILHDHEKPPISDKDQQTPSNIATLSLDFGEKVEHQNYIRIRWNDVIFRFFYKKAYLVASAPSSTLDILATGASCIWSFRAEKPVLLHISILENEMDSQVEEGGINDMPLFVGICDGKSKKIQNYYLHPVFLAIPPSHLPNNNPMLPRLIKYVLNAGHFHIKDAVTSGLLECTAYMRNSDYEPLEPWESAANAWIQVPASGMNIVHRITEETHGEIRVTEMYAEISISENGDLRYIFFFTKSPSGPQPVTAILRIPLFWDIPYLRVEPSPELYHMNNQMNKKVRKFLKKIVTSRIPAPRTRCESPFFMTAHLQAANEKKGVQYVLNGEFRGKKGQPFSISMSRSSDMEIWIPQLYCVLQRMEKDLPQVCPSTEISGVFSKKPVDEPWAYLKHNAFLLNLSDVSRNYATYTAGFKEKLFEKMVDQDDQGEYSLVVQTHRTGKTIFFTDVHLVPPKKKASEEITHATPPDSSVETEKETGPAEPMPKIRIYVSETSVTEVPARTPPKRNTRSNQNKTVKGVKKTLSESSPMLLQESIQLIKFWNAETKESSSRTRNTTLEERRNIYKYVKEIENTKYIDVDAKLQLELGPLEKAMVTVQNAMNRFVPGHFSLSASVLMQNLPLGTLESETLKMQKIYGFVTNSQYNMKIEPEKQGMERIGIPAYTFNTSVSLVLPREVTLDREAAYKDLKLNPVIAYALSVKRKLKEKSQEKKKASAFFLDRFVIKHVVPLFESNPLLGSFMRLLGGGFMQKVIVFGRWIIGMNFPSEVAISEFKLSLIAVNDSENKCTELLKAQNFNPSYLKEMENFQKSDLDTDADKKPQTILLAVEHQKLSDFFMDKPIYVTIEAQNTLLFFLKFSLSHEPSMPVSFIPIHKYQSGDELKKILENAERDSEPMKINFLIDGEKTVTIYVPSEVFNMNIWDAIPSKYTKYLQCTGLTLMINPRLLTCLNTCLRNLSMLEYREDAEPETRQFAIRALKEMAETKYLAMKKEDKFTGRGSQVRQT